ncbi:MupG family TIM beta-alpha barrel fold protein [Companilactobacillus insicii]|uniref:MupG family TIM beta-alpha barrel fold protein n=1 Tax=Companilactobacillus insicii TaxID=1732567 RepID=UPI000F7A7098|nr:MupG family TIM beta-alpha barrel fold protein [Companilactobacillus insicii]
MIGFSFYLNQTITKETIEYFKNMKDSGFSEVFTSTDIPNDKLPSYFDNLYRLSDLTKELDLKLIVGVSNQSFEILSKQTDFNNYHDQMTFRLDSSFSNENIAQLYKSESIALDASTIGNSDIVELKKLKVNFSDLDAWYDSYPHIDTGLDLTWFAQKNRWLKKLGFQIHAFVTGSEPLNEPFNAGMPTLERHRKALPFIAAIELQKLDVDNVVIGDSYLEPSQQKSFYAYFTDGYIPLHMSGTRIGTPKYLFTEIFHNRKDPARDLIRLTESRKMNLNTIEPTNNTNRIFGSVTIDNRLFETYMGEIQIVCTHLPASQKVNVLGKIIKDDLKLLSYIDGGAAFKLIKV